MLKPEQALMVQGATSDAGKSVLVAALCRVLARKGGSVAPFKSQNMALNSAVTSDGGEIGRAQAVQAQACNVEPSVHMNPILLKPHSDVGAQVIVQGKVFADIQTIGYQSYKSTTLPFVLDSFAQLRSKYDTVIVEGAGSPAEINLRENDIANMGFAEEVDIPVIIVADIDRGGVFAHLYGTLALLSESEQNRVIGFVINRFRGDISLLEPGLDWLEQKTGKPVLGVLPYLHGLNIEAEDAVDSKQITGDQTKLIVRVPIFPRMSNHTDFDPLRLNPDIDFQYVGMNESLSNADLIILPGTKSVRADLDYLRQQGWDKEIKRHVRLGGKVIGICAGYQMLGTHINDPHGIEGEPGNSDGLALLDVETELKPVKQLTRVSGEMSLDNDRVAVSGYEIHAGVSCVNEHQPISLIQLQEKVKIDKEAPLTTGSLAEGAVSECNHILGTYLHGIFDTKEASKMLYRWAGPNEVCAIDSDAMKEQGIDRIADAVEKYIDLGKLWPELSIARNRQESVR